MDQAEFDRRRELLRQSIATLEAMFVRTFPDGYLFDADYAEAHNLATAYDTPMRPLAQRIYDVMESFDLMQEGIGLQNGEEPRFRKFLKGE